MQKTKLGISASLIAAGIYFLGAINFLPAFILAGYVLLFEGDSWLKKAAVKMTMVVIIFGILSVMVGMMQDVFSILNLTFGAIINKTIRVPLNIDGILLEVISILRSGLLLIMGVKATVLGSVEIKFIDNSIDRNM
ncbi:MAG: hypothetical protein GX327_06700 [Epulopiscium sp.]|jgi:hypothetical protein|nr:hypothetical protein [Candidatus Epulonipiscium sp.]